MDIFLFGNCRVKYDDQLNCPRVKVTIDSDVKSYEEVENDKKEKEIERETNEHIGNQNIANCSDEIWEKEEKKIQIQSFSDSKYNNCPSSENESEAMKLQKIEENGYVFVEEESSESLFSLSIESRKQENSGEMDDDDDDDVNSSITIGYGNRSSSVLNQVENLSRWKKEVTATTIGIGASLEMNDDEKENVNLGIIIPPFSEEQPSFKKLNPNSKQHLKAEDSEFAAVDTSLSSWLVESGKSPPIIKESPNSIIGRSSSKFEDRPILGALTIDEIKEHSVLSGRSPSRHSQDDERPIIGTVGSYWSRTCSRMSDRFLDYDAF